jgi:hypothetical protein
MFKKMKRLFCLMILTLIGYSLSAQGLLYELKQLYQLDQLPQFRNGVVREFSSYDTTGANDDGFYGTYSFLRMEGDKQVVAEMTGPGVINRIHTPTPTEDTIEFYFDGEKTPRISMPISQLFSSNKFPFLEPICGHEIGGYYCYLPITYSKSCKVLYSGKMLFWQLQYRSYPEGTQVKSFSPDWDEQETAALKRAVDIWGKYGTNILQEFYKDFEVTTTDVRIAPGGKKQVFEMKKGGRIIGIEVEGINKLNRNDNRLILKAKWDNEDAWAINAPMKDFFGYYYGEKSMRSLLGGSAGDISYFYYPMPFSKNAKLEIELLKSDIFATTNVSLSVRIFYMQKPLERNEVKFYAHWRRDTKPEIGQPYLIMPKISGKGHYVGTILSCQGRSAAAGTSYFEGDDVVTVDGELSIHGTGSEDFFNGGYYDLPDRWDMAHSLASHGCLGYSDPLSRTGAFRHYIIDKLTFNKDFCLTIEHGPEGNKSLVDYRSVAFYYADKSVPQESPVASMTEYPTKESVRYNALHMKTLAMRNGTMVIGETIDEKRVLILEAKSQAQMLVKFGFSTASDGLYKVYCSYFKTPSSGEIRFMNRQVPLTDWKNMNNTKEEFVQKEYIGTINVQDDMCTITFFVKGNESRKFFLQEIVLEKE